MCFFTFYDSILNDCQLNQDQRNHQNCFHSGSNPDIPVAFLILFVMNLLKKMSLFKKALKGNSRGLCLGTGVLFE